MDCQLTIKHHYKIKCRITARRGVRSHKKCNVIVECDVDVEFNFTGRFLHAVECHLIVDRHVMVECHLTVDCHDVVECLLKVKCHLIMQ